MTLIREAGELVAVVGRTRAYLLPHVEHLPEPDQLRRHLTPGRDSLATYQ